MSIEALAAQHHNGSSCVCVSTGSTRPSSQAADPDPSEAVWGARGGGHPQLQLTAKTAVENRSPPSAKVPFPFAYMAPRLCQ